MDPVLLSRIQFALTIGFHFIFPPLTIGLSWIIVWMMTCYLRTGSKLYETMSRFWIKLFGLSFALGVATGITMEFQFGTNWAEYSRFVGDIFGAPLAVEAVIAFFLESTFLSVLLLGWNRISPRLHWFSSLMVAVGATLSAFWIIVANSWQQTPAGYHIAHGRAELTSFAQVVFNPSTIPRFLHTMDAALITGSMFMLGISAYFILKRRNLDFAKESVKIALFVMVTASLLQGLLGHIHTIQVAKTQPLKLAAIEGLLKSQTHAPLAIFCYFKSDSDIPHRVLPIPSLLSIMIYGDKNSRVRGLTDFPRNEWPPLAITSYSFHIMVFLGIYFIGLGVLGVFLLWRKKLFENRIFLQISLLSVPLPFITNELGWITTEVGRQPWIVYRLLKTNDAISVTVPAGQILATIILFCLIYALLFAAWIMVLKREMNRGPADSMAKRVE